MQSISGKAKIYNFIYLTTKSCSCYESNIQGLLKNVLINLVFTSSLLHLYYIFGIDTQE